MPTCHHSPGDKSSAVRLRSTSPFADTVFAGAALAAPQVVQSIATTGLRKFSLTHFQPNSFRFNVNHSVITCIFPCSTGG